MYEKIGYLAGVIAGVVIGLVLVMILFKFANKNKRVATTYDERQKIIRGNGYKFSFYTVITALAVLGVFDLSGFVIPVSNTILYYTVILLGVVVCITYDVFKDAYWGMNNDKVRYGIMMFVIAICNFAGCIGLFKNGFFVDGKLSNLFVNFECGCLMCYLGLLCIVKYIIEKNRKAGDDNEES